MRALGLFGFIGFVACAYPRDLPQLSPVPTGSPAAAVKPPEGYEKIDGSNSLFMDFASDGDQFENPPSGRVINQEGRVVVEAGAGLWGEAKVVKQTLLLVDGVYAALSHAGSDVWHATTAHAWDLKTGKKIFTREGLYGASLHPSGDKIALCYEDNVTVWDLVKNEVILTIPVRCLYQILYAAGGETLLTRSYNQGSGYAIQLWSAKTGAPITDSKIQVMWKITLSADGETFTGEIPTGEITRSQKTWSARTGELR